MVLPVLFCPHVPHVVSVLLICTILQILSPVALGRPMISDVILVVIVCPTVGIHAMVRIDECGGVVNVEAIDTSKQEQTTVCPGREFALWNPTSPPMPRRPKKRPANIGNGSAPSFDRSKGKIKPWNTVDDIPLDEEDECGLAFSYPERIH